MILSFMEEMGTTKLGMLEPWWNATLIRGIKIFREVLKRKSEIYITAIDSLKFYITPNYPTDSASTNLRPRASFPPEIAK